MKELKVKIMKNINILLIKILQLNQLHMALLEKILINKSSENELINIFRCFYRLSYKNYL